ncbi:MAG: alkyl sulfatase BDS1-like metallo-beta-lactamase superfamily hydrolase [Pseudomonadales bacterium]|jgi:alkyl sulfatase BDS1-like metallo-beta-lactamase superfamily hydrolase
MNWKTPLFSTLITSILVGCGGSTEVPVDKSSDQYGFSAATETTAKTNKEVLANLPFHNRQDFDDAIKGFIATDEALSITNARGEIIWRPDDYGFITGDAPASANPSLWRQAKLNNINGLFKVSERIYQIRGYDLANMSIIEGDSGWIVIDPLTASETAAKGMALVRKHLGDKPITGIIFTHSHVDHFGGALGIISSAEIAERNIPVIAPIGFIEEATSENVIAGNAMMRRSTFSYGKNLPRTQRGHIGSGLGKAPAYGTTGILEPNYTVDTTGQELTVDGVDFIFQNASGSEAPSELTFYLPQLKTYCGAEVLSRNMHNIYTLRGAKVRDAVKWAGFINEAMDMAANADNYFASHHWPMWGNEQIIEYLEKQRDMYKYIHDQTMRLANSGLTPNEIAEEIEMPASLQQQFYNRGYYGTLKHNAKAVYQHYYGWYDGNPANLDALTEVDAGQKYVTLMGGPDAVIAAAKTAYDKGEYRWVAQLLNHLVFAEPDNRQARGLLATVYDQLGYQSESGVWRDVYLNAALELRNGAPEKGMNMADAKGIITQTPVSKFFDAMSVRLNGMKADGVEKVINVRITDLNENHVLGIKNSVFHHTIGTVNAEANASIAISHSLLTDMLTGSAGIKDVLTSDELDIQGSTIDLIQFFSLFEAPETTFNIVTP